MDVGVIDAADTRALRRTVLRPHLGPGDELPGDTVPGAVHIGARAEDGRVIGTCFVYRDPCPWRPEVDPAWHLRQMATDPEHRGHGVGAAVLAAAVEVVRSGGSSLVWCHARETAAEFYARHGWRRHGAVFIDTHHPVPHQRMYCDLGAEPPAGPTSSEE